MRQRTALSVLRSATARAATAARPTSYDVALLAGVSQSAVSRCFSPGASISTVTRTKVEHAARSLGYSPNALARSLITRRSGLVGLVVTMATLRYSPQIVHDLSDALQTAGLMPLLTTLDDEHALAKAWPQILNYRTEAIVSLATVAAPLIREAAAHGIPLVLINRTAAKGRAASIRCDHTNGVRELVQALVASGHRRLAFIAGPDGAPVSEERRAGFEAALSTAQLLPRAMQVADYTYEGGHAAARAILTRDPHVDALVCANDSMALGALDACRDVLGLDVPGQISITGFDDVPEGRRSSRHLTTIRQPTEEMAALAVAEVLRLSRASGAERPAQHVIAGTILMRGSSR